MSDYFRVKRAPGQELLSAVKQHKLSVTLFITRFSRNSQYYLPHVFREGGTESASNMLQPYAAAKRNPLCFKLTAVRQVKPLVEKTKWVEDNRCSLQ